MYVHTAFGLTICAPFALPAMRVRQSRANSHIDVEIACQPALEVPCTGNPYGTLTVTHPADVTLAWDGIGAFRVQDGCRIEIHPWPQSTYEELNLCLSGAVFAMLLYQRGLSVMHGSVFDLDGEAVAVLAAKGGGKSTLAMSMDQAGCPLLSDDILALDVTRSILALPGFAQIKLWPDALSHLGRQPERYAPLRPEAAKRGVPVEPAAQSALPLRHIFVLGRADEAAIQPLGRREALLALLPHWYLSRFETRGMQSLQALNRQFGQCTRLAQDVPVSLLLRPQSLAQLPQVVSLIKEYVATARGRQAPNEDSGLPATSMRAGGGQHAHSAT